MDKKGRKLLVSRMYLHNEVQRFASLGSEGDAGVRFSGNEWIGVRREDDTTYKF
jgi:hypothetical protein